MGRCILFRLSKIRSLKPEFWTDAKVSRVSVLARWVSLGLWSVSDDYGVVPHIPRA